MKKHLRREVLFTPKEMLALKGNKTAYEWFYRRLAEGDSVLSESRICQIADQLGFAFRSCGYFCAVVREVEGGLPVTLLQNCKTALKSIRNDSFCYIGDGLCVVILLSDDKADRQKVVDKLHVLLNKGGSPQVQIGVGRSYENLEMLSHSRIEACEALSSIGSATCISYIDDIYVMRSLTTRKLDGEKRKIVEHFKAGRLEEMMTDLTLLAEIVRSESPVREGMPYPTSIRRTILELLFEIMHISADAGVDVDLLLGYEDPYTKVFAFNGTPLILNWFHEVSGKLYSGICDVNNRNHSNMLKKAMQFITLHLSDPELSLSLVSDELCITPSYFSAFFIREVGMVSMNMSQILGWKRRK